MRLQIVTYQNMVDKRAHAILVSFSNAFQLASTFLRYESVAYESESCTSTVSMNPSGVYMCSPSFVALFLQ